MKQFLHSLSLVLKSLRAKSLVVITLVALPFAAQAHDFSTSFLTLEPGDDATQLQWQWRFTEHDLEALVGSTNADAALRALPAWLTLSTAQTSACKLEPNSDIVRGVHAGQRTLTFSGTAPCAHSTDITYTPHLIHLTLPDHKIIEGSVPTM